MRWTWRATDCDMAEVRHGIKRSGQYLLVAGALDRPAGSQTVGHRFDLFDDIWRPAVECVVRAEGLGKIESTLNDVDDDDVA